MNCPNVFAIFLPQFHRTIHNDEWWGEGFTDWDAVKHAEPLFEGHCQPCIPARNEYYDLLNKNTMVKQAATAKEYGIDGFIFYHYYFGNGRMELEKPAENLLKWKDIDMPFCFSWANQSWIRTWSKIAGNVWGEKLEKKDKCLEKNGVLVEQIYGDEDEWTRHFNYLLPFFVDSRYIRINDCPVFIVYSPSNVGCMRQMIDCWRNLAKNNGLPGLYLIGYNIYNNDAGFDALMMHEPGFSIRKLNKLMKVNVRNGVRCIDYEDFWENTLSTPPVDGIKTFYTGACGYDSTPRRGEGGECIVNRTPELFEKYLIELLKKTAYYKNEFVAVNAWNEWGEGMYLEADEDNGYAYLEAVRNAKQNIITMDASKVKDVEYRIQGDGNIEDEQSFLLGKYKYYYTVCSKWIDLIRDGKLLFRKVLELNNIHSVAIYGFADIGHKLNEQLRNEGIMIKYAIDQYVGSVTNGIKVYRPEEELPQVDAIIITAYEPNEIRQLLCKKNDCKVLSIIELIDTIIEREDL